MAGILPDILSLTQYLYILANDPVQLRPDRCPCCNRPDPWCHGGYGRKADRAYESEESLNPIWILRYFCPSCRKTFSVLPECIPPRRWYLWTIQQMSFLLALMGKSASAIAREIIPSRHTVRRWLLRFKEQFHLHADTLKNCWNDLGRTSDFSEFWQKCLEKIPLSTAMLVCHLSGIFIP